MNWKGQIEKGSRVSFWVQGELSRALDYPIPTEGLCIVSPNKNPLPCTKKVRKNSAFFSWMYPWLLTLHYAQIRLQNMSNVKSTDFFFFITSLNTSVWDQYDPGITRRLLCVKRKRLLKAGIFFYRKGNFFHNKLIFLILTNERRVKLNL